MPIDDRLRSAFAAQAEAFLPEGGEQRLAQVHHRSRRRTAAFGTVIGLAAASLVAVAGMWGGADHDAQAPEPADRVTPTPSSSWSGEVIPDSTWTRVATRAQGRELGVTEGDLRAEVGPDGRLPLTWRFEGGAWSQAGEYTDGGPMEVGDSGTFTYDAAGRLVTTSSSPGCPNCVTTIVWRITGDRLVLSLVHAPTGPPPGLLGRLVTEGTWRRSP